MDKDNKKVSLVSGLVVAGALLYGGWRLAINKNSESRAARGLEARIVQDDEQKVKEINEFVEELNKQLPDYNKPEETNKINYSQEDKILITKTLYGEAANQTRKARKFIVRTILNRVREPEYPSNIKDVIYDYLAISCIKDEKNKNWKQATGELPRNKYEEKVYQRCKEDANSVLNGERLNIPHEDEIIAYHDTSVQYRDLVAKEKKIQEKWEKIGKRYDGFWMHLEPVVQEDDLIFYRDKNKITCK